MIRRADEVDLETFKLAAEFSRIGNSAVRKAQEESRQAGVPNVYSINGILHWELPDGSLTTVDPWKDKPAGDKISFFTPLLLSPASPGSRAATPSRRAAIAGRWRLVGRLAIRGC